MRVVLANEPRSCREVIKFKPNDIEGETPRLRPDAVVRTRVTPSLQAAGGWWMEVRLENGAMLMHTSDTDRSWEPNSGPEIPLAFVDWNENEGILEAHRNTGGRR